MPSARVSKAAECEESRWPIHEPVVPGSVPRPATPTQVTLPLGPDATFSAPRFPDGSLIQTTDTRLEGMDNAYPATWTVRKARDAYLVENGFTMEAYDAPFTDAVVLGVTFKVPNTKAHRSALIWHDLHHALTGYGTDPAGEGEISAWEARRGLRPIGVYTGLIVLAGVAMGGLVAPRRTWRAYAASGKSNTTLFHEKRTYEAVLDMNLGDLREELGLPREGLAQSRRLHHGAPKAA